MEIHAQFQGVLAAEAIGVIIDNLITGHVASLRPVNVIAAQDVREPSLTSIVPLGNAASEAARFAFEKIAL